MAERYPLRRYLGVREIDGRKTYAIQFSGFYQQAAVFFFDPETYRVVRIGSAKIRAAGRTTSRGDDRLCGFPRTRAGH